MLWYLAALSAIAKILCAVGDLTSRAGVSLYDHVIGELNLREQESKS